MGQRGKLVIPNRFIKKYGEKFPMWSFSKVNSFENCTHEYYLNRIKKLRGSDNIYSLAGSCSHDILELYYNNEIKHEDMSQRFESDFLDIEVSDYNFSNDEDKNVKMRDKYKDCVSDFFKHHKRMAKKVATEKLVWIDVNGHVFMGYVDAIHKDGEGNLIITDFKTSSIYKGSKIQQQGKQLLLYALGLYQGGIDINKIKCRWLFMKYVSVTYRLKNGKYKTSHAERNNWVKAIKTPLKKDILALYKCEEWQADLKVDECMRNNSLDILDQSIQDKYELSDCYVYPEVNHEEFEKLKAEFVSLIGEINAKGKDEDNWQREEIQPSEEYYCNVLCGQRKNCQYYKNYLERFGKKQTEDDDIMSELEELELTLPF